MARRKNMNEKIEEKYVDCAKCQRSSLCACDVSLILDIFLRMGVLDPVIRIKNCKNFIEKGGDDKNGTSKVTIDSGQV